LGLFGDNVFLSHHLRPDQCRHRSRKVLPWRRAD
jgi:hypothetical protein